MKIYIAKIYTISTYGFRCLDEEKGFTSYSKELAYLREEFFEEDDSDSTFARKYFAEIVEYVTHDNEVIINKTRFDCLGKVFATLKDTSNQKFCYQQEINKNFVPTYNVGDIVMLKYKDGESVDLFTQTIGIVSGTPRSYVAWKEKYNLPDDAWDEAYLVEFIGDNGYLTHCHPSEEEMEIFNEKLPEELVLLEVLSRHFKKEITLDGKIIEDLRARNIYALNTKNIKDVGLI